MGEIDSGFFLADISSYLTYAQMANDIMSGPGCKAEVVQILVVQGPVHRVHIYISIYIYIYTLKDSDSLLSKF